jgi:hypothetical protein
MNRITSLLAAMSLLTLIPATPALADTGGNSANADLGAVAFCKVDVPTNFPDQPLGDCLGIQSTAGRGNLTGAAPNVCEFVQDEIPDLFAEYYTSFNACVQDGGSAFF